jgi:hypothetical protein
MSLLAIMMILWGVDRPAPLPRQPAPDVERRAAS